MSKPISRVLFSYKMNDSHLSCAFVAKDIMRHYQSREGNPCARGAALFGLAPNGVYMAGFVAKSSVRSYRTFPPLPLNFCKQRRFVSVALSLKSPSPDVIWHPYPRCSDFPHQT